MRGENALATAFFIAILAAACSRPSAPAGEKQAALTAAQCMYFQANGSNRICHKTGSAKNPYVLLQISEQSCIDAHALHPGDYVATESDPDCMGGGCLPEGAPWDSMLPCCNGLEVVGGVCTGIIDLCSDVTCRASDQCHLAGTCDPALGTCSDPAAADGTVCNDGSACTQSDACQAGACIGANPVVCVAGDQCHLAGTCNPASGTCSNPAAPDGIACDGGLCKAGACRAPTLAFHPHQDFTTASMPFGLAIGEVNNDGKPDLAIALIAADLLSVQLGNGDGTFRAAITSAAGSLPQFVAIADFNGDGNADLAVLSGFAFSDVRILLGHGDGTFGTAANLGVDSHGLRYMEVADLNGDGKPDIATANEGGVSVLLGKGDGTFQNDVTYSAGRAPNSVATADFNSDGILDLVTADLNGSQVSVLLGNGGGAFSAAVNHPLGSSAYVAKAGDMNGDGKPDLAVALYGTPDLVVLLGNGDGTFQNPVFRAGGFTVAHQDGLHIVDLNGDGKLDLAVLPFAADSVSVLRGNGDGTFQAAVRFTLGSDAITLQAGDLNGDGKLDLATTSFGDKTVSVLLNASY